MSEVRNERSEWSCRRSGAAPCWAAVVALRRRVVRQVMRCKNLVACNSLQEAANEQNAENARAEKRSQTLRHKYLQTRFGNARGKPKRRNFAARVLPMWRVGEGKNRATSRKARTPLLTFNADKAARRSPTTSSPAAGSAVSEGSLRPKRTEL